MVHRGRYNQFQTDPYAEGDPWGAIAARGDLDTTSANPYGGGGYDTKITSGWTDAYQVDFTAGGGDGDRPIVTSYSSSPPFTIPEDGTRPTTSALLDTCFRQVEYAGVLAGSDNPEGMEQFIDFMLEGRNSADLTNMLGSGNPNTAAMEFIKPEIKAMSAVFPDQETAKKLEMLKPMNADERRMANQIWTEIKAE